jgi:uncharacterized protein with FMN-binding domain
MKNILTVVCVLCVIVSCASLGGSDGVYEGAGWGYRGVIRVLVHLTGDYITDIDIIDFDDDPNVGGEAIDELMELVIEYNSTDLDAVSGATESSKGFLDAVRNAIERL